MSVCKILNSLLLAVLFLFAVGESKAQEVKTYLTMQDAIYRALNKNHEIKASEFGQKKASWDIKQAWAQLFPVISFNSRYNRIDEQTFAERDFRRYLPPELANQMPQTVFQDSYSSSIDLDMPLFNGVLLNGLMIANEGEAAAESMNNSTKRNIIFQVISGYLNVLKSKEVLSLQKEYLELSKLNYEKAERLFKADRYSKTESLRWKVEYQQQKSVVVNSENVLRAGITNLNKLLDLNMNSKIEVSSEIPKWLKDEKKLIEALNDDDLLEMININDDALVETNAMLKAAKSNDEINRLLYKNSYSSYMPNVSLSYSYGWRENNTLELDDYSPKTLSINLRMPIFTSFQNYTALKSNYYTYKKGQEEFISQLQETRFLLTSTVNNIINLKTQISLSRASVQFSEANYRTVESQKEKGLISNIDFIDAKLNMQNSKLQAINNNYDFISGMIELYYLLGKKLDELSDK
ncbi:MAG: TolC family protein [Melioribacteraceae bacterium]|nr:TolC family protein [Melioribacteraceae bacterium]